MKVLIVGFDGATWDLINRFDLPNFKKITENGVSATMKSTYPPITIPAWPCMFSGYNPGKIGAADFYRREQNSFKLVNSSTWKGKLMWDRLKNIKFLVLNIPFTYPPYRINGDIISIDFSPLRGYTYPPKLEKELEKKFDIYSIRNSEKKGLKGIYEKERIILKIFKYLNKKNNYDIAIVRFGIPDQVTHKTTCFQEIKHCHYLMDELLGEIIESADFAHLFLVSDHGVQKSKRRFCINTWLYKNGYLSLTFKGRILLIFRRFYEKFIFKEYTKAFIKKISNYSHKRQKNVPIPYIPRVLNLIDYKKSLAFGYLSNSLKQSLIYLQIDSSIPEYDNLIKKLSRELLLVKDDDGERVIERVFTKHKIYSGKYMDNMPDIIVESNQCILTSLLPDVFPKINSYYTHSIDGIFVASGKCIKKGEKINTVKIYDIAPTLLHILGLPVPEDMDGRVIREIFVPDSPLGKSRPKYVKPEYYIKHITLKNKIAKLKNKL